MAAEKQPTKTKKVTIRLKQASRYSYRGNVYKRGQVYAAANKLAQDLVATGYFEIVMIDDDGNVVQPARRQLRPNRRRNRGVAVDDSPAGMRIVRREPPKVVEV